MWQCSTVLMSIGGVACNGRKGIRSKPRVFGQLPNVLSERQRGNARNPWPHSTRSKISRAELTPASEKIRMCGGIIAVELPAVGKTLKKGDLARHWAAEYT